jgi:hypothetical protein
VPDKEMKKALGSDGNIVAGPRLVVNCLGVARQSAKGARSHRGNRSILPSMQQDLFDAVYERIRTDRQEASPPRHELRQDVKKLCWQLLGPPPGHPLYKEMHPVPEVPQPDEAQAEPVKKPGKQQGRRR